MTDPVPCWPPLAMVIALSTAASAPDFIPVTSGYGTTLDQHHAGEMPTLMGLIQGRG